MLGVWIFCLVTGNGNWEETSPTCNELPLERGVRRLLSLREDLTPAPSSTTATSLNAGDTVATANLGDGPHQTQMYTHPTASLGTTTNPRTAALSERDFDGRWNVECIRVDSPLLWFHVQQEQYGFYMCVDAPLGKYVPSSGSRYATDASAGYYVHTAIPNGSADTATTGQSWLQMQDTMLIPPWEQDNPLKLLA